MDTLKKVAESTGLTYDNKRTLLYGTYKNYTIVAKDKKDTREYILLIPIKLENESSQEILNGFLLNLKQSIPHSKTTYQNNGIVISFKYKLNVQKNMIAFTGVLNQVIDFCVSNHLQSCCDNCGDTNSLLSVVSYNESPMILCDTCFNALLENTEMNKEIIKQKKGNVFSGIVGALLGSLIGVVLWVFIYQLGYIAAIAGLVTVICALKGYEKFSGKLDVVGLIISLVISILMLLFANNICLAIDIYKAFKNEYSIDFFDAFQAIPDFMKEPDIKSAFLGDLFIGYFLMVVASIRTIYYTFKQSNHLIEIKKLEQSNNNSPVM